MVLSTKAYDNKNYEPVEQTSRGIWTLQKSVPFKASCFICKDIDEKNPEFRAAGSASVFSPVFVIYQRFMLTWLYPVVEPTILNFTMTYKLTAPCFPTKC